MTDGELSQARAIAVCLSVTRSILDPGSWRPRVHQDRRADFLLKLYEQLWKSIEREQGDLWKFIGFFAATFVSNVAIKRTDVDTRIALLFLIATPTWGINIVISSWKWFERNRMMIINIEKEFLAPEDVGRILPRTYHERRAERLPSFDEFIPMGLFALAIPVSIWVHWDDVTANKQTTAFTIILVLVGVAVTALHWMHRLRSIERFIQDTTPDREP
jgi:hypothetical protein